jgi:UDP-GlcNAc:undecaprenyl-phosphate GlcNAc-1-phosphate transferase
LLAALVFAGSLAGAAVLLHAIGGVLESPALARTNYSGRDIPTGAGILFPIVFVPVYTVILVSGSRTLHFYGVRESMLLLVTGMCLLGLVDDVAGDRSVRGFKGHFSSLARGRMTTGMLKAAGGFVLAVAVSLPFSRRWWEVLLNAALIALCANLANLLDLRPGRALKVFVPALAGVVALNWTAPRTVIPYLLCIGAVALVLLPGDLAETRMLGDAGSNVLGATIGLGIAVGAGPWWKSGVLVFLILANAVSEKYSFSDIISSNRALDWIDSLGRKVHQRAGDNNN